MTSSAQDTINLVRNASRLHPLPRGGHYGVGLSLPCDLHHPPPPPFMGYRVETADISDKITTEN